MEQMTMQMTMQIKTTKLFSSPQEGLQERRHGMHQHGSSIQLLLATYLYVAAHDRRPAPRVSVPRESESQAAQMGNGADNLTPILLEPGQSKAVLSVHCRRLVDQSLFASFATVHVISDHPDAA